MAIDLHSHTTASDGTVEPLQLVRMAEALGLEALGITDHDTFAGWDEASSLARSAKLELVCGIELSAKYRFKGAPRATSVHVLGYFLRADPPASFREWLGRAQHFRRDRNARLARRLQSLGLDITLNEAEALGRTLTGRPHFAKLLVRKGYAADPNEAFRTYLGERGKAYVEREEPSLEAALARIHAAGGIASLAHPIRVEEHASGGLEPLVREWKDAGLGALEAWYSDHGPADIRHYRELARRNGLAVTGGTDFHGDTKPGVSLGTGRGGMCIPREVLDRLRA